MLCGVFKYKKMEIQHIHPFDVSYNEEHKMKKYKMWYEGETYNDEPHGMGLVTCKEDGFKGAAMF